MQIQTSACGLFLAETGTPMNHVTMTETAKAVTLTCSNIPQHHFTCLFWHPLIFNFIHTELFR
jgi:hypothetical protein